MPTPEKKPAAPRTTRAAAKPPEPAGPPPLPDRLTKQQIEWLLQGIEPFRVKHKGGQSNLQSYDVRNHLNEVFGFANWDGEVIAMDLVFDVPKQLSSGKPGAYVCYRATYRLTIKALSGKVLATYTEVAAGDGQMPANMRFEAHDFAMKTAESQALKRCAINLGNQYGLSLYAKTTNSITRTTYQHPDNPELKPLTEAIAEETDPDATHEAIAAAEAFQAAEASQAPVTPQTPAAAPPPAPEPASVQQVPQQVAQEQTAPELQQTPAILADIADLQEALTFLDPERRANLMAKWKRTTLPALARIQSQEQLAQAWQLYDAVKPPTANQQVTAQEHDNQQSAGNLYPEHSEAGNLALTQQRQAQIDQARAHFPNAPQHDDTPPPYGDEAGWQEQNEFYSN
jgi:Rad52/22 family double-strand break repair protein